MWKAERNGMTGQGRSQQAERRNNDRSGVRSTEVVPEDGGNGVVDDLRPVVEVFETVVVQGFERLAKQQERT
jgi:hypothetical protein